MAIISRATKAGSSDGNYVPGVVIQSSEVNADFNTLYNDYDGNITNANIAASAAILYSKLNLTTSILTTDLANGIVTPAKLALQASTPAYTTVSPTGGLTITTVDTAVVTLPSITTRGGHVLLTGTIVWSMQVALNTGPTITILLKDNGATIATLAYATNVPNITNLSLLQYPLPTPSFTVTPAAGAHVYVISASLSPGGTGNISTPGASTGIYSAIEFA